MQCVDTVNDGNLGGIRHLNVFALRKRAVRLAVDTSGGFCRDLAVLRALETYGGTEGKLA